MIMMFMCVEIMTRRIAKLQNITAKKKTAKARSQRHSFGLCEIVKRSPTVPAGFVLVGCFDPSFPPGPTPSIVWTDGLSPKYDVSPAIPSRTPPLLRPLYRVLGVDRRERR